MKPRIQATYASSVRRLYRRNRIARRTSASNDCFAPTLMEEEYHQTVQDRYHKNAHGTDRTSGFHHPPRRRPLHQRLAVPGTQYRHIARDLRNQTRMREQDYQRRSRYEPLELRQRLWAEIRAALPRPRLRIDQDHVGCPGATTLYLGMKHIPRRNRIWSADVFIDDRNAKR